MSAPDPADHALPSDPALYARKPLLGPMFWTMIVLCLACMAAGAAIAHFGPTWFAPKAAAPPAPAPAAERPLPLPVAAPDRAGASDPGLDVGGLEARLALVEAGQQRTLDAAAAALAAASLAQAAQGEAPFADTVEGLERVLAPSPEIRALERLARDGAPSRAGLAAGFDALAGRVLVVAEAPAADAGVLARLRHAVSRIVVIRQIDQADGEGPSALLVRAQARLDAGDIDGALRVLDGLPPGVRPVLAPWRAQAERRAEIDRLTAAVRDEALGGLVRVSRRQADARLAGAAP